MLYELWLVSGLDGELANVTCCCRLDDPLDAHEAARLLGPGEYVVTTPAGEVVRQFVLVPETVLAVAEVA